MLSEWKYVSDDGEVTARLERLVSVDATALRSSSSPQQ
jgi:hypothetical protein